MELYLITRLDAISTFCIAMAVVLISAIFIGYILKISLYEDSIDKYLKKAFKWMVPMFIFFSLTAVFVPTTKQACAIYVGNYLLENEDAKEIPDKVLRLANEYLDELIEGREKQ